MSLLDAIREVGDDLTEPHQHAETLEYWDRNRHRKTRRRTVTMPGLLQQLADMYTHAAGEEDGARSVPDSKPPGHWDALSRHTAVTLGALGWVQRLRLDPRDTVESNIRALVGVSPTLDPDDARRLLKDMRRWKTWAEIITGWKTPPWTPVAPCPAAVAGEDGTTRSCGKRSLRVNLTYATAYCPSCGTTWDAIGLRTLGKYVQRYKQAADAEATVARLRARSENKGDTAS